MDCALRISGSAPNLRTSLQIKKSTFYLRQAKVGLAENLVTQLGGNRFGAGTLQHLLESNETNGAPSVPVQLRLLLSQGDLFRHQGSFVDAMACYDGAAGLLEHLQSSEFVAPIVDVMEASKPAPPLSSPSLGCELNGEILWRQGRTCWLLGRKEEAVGCFEQGARLPGSSEAHVQAHYHLGCSHFSSASESDKSMKTGHSHLCRALHHAQSNAHPELLRNVLRALAVHSSPASAEWRSWLVCRSIGVAFSDGLLSNLCASPEPDQLQVEALEAARGPSFKDGDDVAQLSSKIGLDFQRHIDKLPSDWVICAVTMEAQGGLVVTRMQVKMFYFLCMPVKITCIVDTFP